MSVKYGDEAEKNPSLCLTGDSSDGGRGTDGGGCHGYGNPA
ncbi:MAG: hypothetical protein ABGZ19_02535 [Verrucomicrobiales bacterium]